MATASSHAWPAVLPLAWPEPLAAAFASAVHLWRIDLTQPLGADALLVLDADENARATRFVFEPHRRRFQVSHAAVRRLLGERLAVAPGDLVFSTGVHGKPRFGSGHRASTDGRDPSTFGSFNLSHSADVGLLLWSQDGGEWGIDVEGLHAVPDMDDLAARVFTPTERSGWLSLPASERSRGFLQLWTRKEACLKAIGAGLTIGPDRFEVGLGDRATARCTSVTIADAAGCQHQLITADLDAGPDVAAAVARVVPA